jgi:FPC/CPF motif-containing protein YcgG
MIPSKLLDLAASSHLFYPILGPSRIPLMKAAPGAIVEDSERQLAQSVSDEIASLIMEKNYPCTAAIQALFRKDYRIGLYGKLGEGERSKALGTDLLIFLEEQTRTGSEYLSFMAVFPNKDESSACEGFSEVEFEERLWRELSLLTNLPEFQNFKWDPEFSANPTDQNFCFSWGGKAFFVVGLHPKSSRRSRKFSQPMLIFNVYEQFRELARQRKYEGMVQTNRRRDVAYQGSVNPTVEKYGDNWEAIQFSGRENGAEWKCPFHHAAAPAGNNKSPSHE